MLRNIEIDLRSANEQKVSRYAEMFAVMERRRGYESFGSCWWPIPEEWW